MRQSTMALLASWLILLAVADASALHGHARLGIGKNYLKGSDWTPVDDHGLMAVSVDLIAPDWPFHVAFGFSYSIANESKADSTAGQTIAVEGIGTELRCGARKYWAGRYGVRPSLGAGGTFVYTEYSGITAEDRAMSNDTNLGFYLDGALSWSPGKGVILGCEASYSRAGVRMFGEDGQGGGLQLGLLLGYAW